MKKRLFFALPLTAGLYPKIYNLEKEINKKFKVNWLPLKNIHLTLIFLGWLNLDDVEKVIKVFKKTFDENPSIFKKLNLKINKIDYGPPNKKRMIWLYLEKNKNLKVIKEKLETALNLEGIRYQKEEREFIPHFNLARLRHFDKLPEIKKDLNWGIILTELHLFESYLEKPFARYESLFSIKLLSS